MSRFHSHDFQSLYQLSSCPRRTPRSPLRIDRENADWLILATSTIQGSQQFHALSAARQTPPPPPLTPPRSHRHTADPPLLPSRFLALPNELFYMIASYLDVPDLNSLLQCSQHMHMLFHEELYRLSIRTKGNSTLYWACTHNQPEVAKRCLRLGASTDIDRTTRHCQYEITPLICAIRNDRPAVVKVLLDHGVDLSPQSLNMVTPLEEAVVNGRDDIILLLLAAGADIHQYFDGYTLLHTAVSSERQDKLGTIRILLDAGADVNAVDEKHDTPLHLARSNLAATLLVSRGADVNAMNYSGRTPLSNAVRFKDARWVRMLLAAGAKVNATSPLGETALFFVNETQREWNMDNFIRSSDDEIARALIDAGANIHHTNFDGSTALHRAAHCGAEATALLLLTRGVLASVRNKKGVTPLHNAAEVGDPNMIRLLLRFGANVNAINYYRTSPLHRMASVPKRNIREAAPGLFEEAMKVLLEAGADVNSTDRIGQTPLMKACYHGYWGFVALMMQHPGINVLLQDKRGKRATDVAKDWGNRGLRNRLADATKLCLEEVEMGLMAGLEGWPVEM